MSIDLQRENFSIDAAQGSHVGHLLSYGLPSWNPQANQRGTERAAFIRTLCNKTVTSECYRLAYQRWSDLVNDSENIATWHGKLMGRLYIGTGNPNVVEANLSVHQTYGMPLIAGSAIKGLLHAFAQRHDVDQNSLDLVFGKSTRNNQLSEAGYVIFHDAWWVPESEKTAFTPEIITVHHQEYYKTKGETAATDFDAPNPNAQISARGTFLFSIEGTPLWVNWAKTLLIHALTLEGIGAKISSGYGLFEEDIAHNRQALSAEQRLDQEVADMTLTGVADLFGQGWNNTKKSRGNEWEILLDKVHKKFQTEIKNWAISNKKGEKKTYTKFKNHFNWE